jgi:MurNAc alpha-1-phosphate uridylyltransferase
MKALILAAGRGERMRPLTGHTAKPLLAVGGKRLIEWHLEKLAALGITEVAINTSHLAGQFAQVLGNGARWGLRLHFSHEGDEPLETGGGLLHALPWLGDAPFLVVNGDIWTDFEFSALPRECTDLAYLVMVDNPAHHGDGDFHLDPDGRLHDAGSPRMTYAGIGLYHPELLIDWRAAVGERPGARCRPPRFPLAPLLRAAMASGRVGGQHHPGQWTDVGTPQRLAELDARLSALRSAPGSDAETAR